MSHSAPISLTIDHVTIAGDSLAALEEAFAGVGLVTDYGGPHSNGVTHMSLLGFDDGSYIELISTIEPAGAGGADTQFWGEQIAANAGPCAWAVYVSDVTEEAKRLAALGVKVDGPRYFNRRRPDGELVEWDLAFLGEGPAGATLPFLIKDLTPRFLRVRPSASISGQGLLMGLEMVVLGVKDLPATSSLFQRLYHWPDPTRFTDSQLEANLAHFPGTVVTLATPATASGWLGRRLSRFGELPCAFLLRTDDFKTACQTYSLEPDAPWLERQVAWFNPDRLLGIRLGIID